MPGEGRLPAISQLVQVPLVRTVIQMKDTRDPELRQQLIESFVLTGEAELALGAVLSAIARGEGQGFFIQGHYGAGKSHLLAILELILTREETRRALAGKAGAAGAWYENIASLVAVIGQNRYLVAAISLVEHSHHEELEDIVLAALDDVLQTGVGKGLGRKTREDYVNQIRELLTERYPEALEAYLSGEKIDRKELFQPDNLALLTSLLRRLDLPYRLGYRRQEAFAELESLVTAHHLAGVVILIDELSEFLRSKPDSRSFNEDIRFLQFLGEISGRLPLWVVATLQEQIEATGAIPPEAFNKIKDRYPVRLQLTGEHIREIISRRLIRQRPEAQDHVHRLYADLTAAFGQLPFSQEEFCRLYPVHPQTVTFLESLRPLFSRHRGVVDFIHARLAGDPDRQIPALLEAPADTLLAPDLIFDHFRDRIQARPETNLYVRQVFHYFQQEIARLLPEGRDQHIGLRLVKLLILAALGATARPLTVRQLAHLLLQPITRLESALNYEYIGDLLKRLYQDGAYLGYQQGATPLEDAFYIDLQADVQLLVRRRLDYIKKSLFPGDGRVFTGLCRWLTDNRLPLANLVTTPRTPVDVFWQQTRREGLLIFTDLTDLSPAVLEELARQALTTATDFILVLGQAEAGNKQLSHLQETLLPALAGPASRAFLFWLPAAVADDWEFLTSALACQVLMAEYEADSSPTGERVRSYLAAGMEELKSRVQDVFRRAYTGGRLITGDGEELPWPTNPAYEAFKSLLEKLAAAVLSRRYPEHAKIAPRGGVLLAPLLQRVIGEFLAPGEVKGRVDAGLKMALDNFLQPLGLAKKAKDGYILQVASSRNPLVAACLESLKGGPVGLAELGLRLRKGPFGLSEIAFQLLILALLHSGLVAAYSHGRRLNLKQIGPYNFYKIEELGLVEVLPEAFQAVLAGVKLLPVSLRQGPLTHGRQQELWDYLVQFQKDMSTRLNSLGQLLETVASYPALAALPLAAARADLNRVASLVAEIKVSYSPREGLERFLVAYQADPLWEVALERTRKLQHFLEQNLNHFLFIHGYLTSTQLVLPDTPAYQDLRRQKARLIELLNSPDVFYQEEVYQQLATAFTLFQRAYTDAYLAEHRRLRSLERFQPYHALREGEAYRFLTLLSQLKQVAAPDALSLVNQLLAAALARQCPVNPEGQLALQPACSCGLALGEKDELPPPAAIQAAALEGIRAYLLALQDPLYQEKIRGFLAGLESVGKGQEATCLRRLLAVDPQDPELLAKLKPVVNRNTIGLINQALAGQVLVVERNLDDLYDLLANRVLKPEQLLDLVRQWLAGREGEQPDPATHIRVIAASRREIDGVLVAETGVPYQSRENLLYDWFAAGYQELLPLWHRHGEAGLALAVTTAWWLPGHHLEPELVARLCSLPGLAPPATTSLQELAQQVFELRAGPPELAGVLLNAARRALAEEDRLAAYWQALAPGGNPSGPELLAIIGRETLFPAILRRAAGAYLEWLSYQDGSELATALQLLEGITPGVPLQPWEGPEPAAYLEACRLATHLLHSLATLTAATPESFDAPAWEKIYTTHLGGMESLYYHLQHQLATLNLMEAFPLARLETELHQILARYSQAFQEFYNQAGSVPGMTLEQLPVKLERYRQRWRPRALYFIWLDGLRRDASEVMLAELEQAGLIQQEIARGLLWAHLPTVTATQLARLQEAGYNLRFLDASGPDQDLAALARKGNRLAPGQEEVALRLNLVDDKVHASTDDYATFLAELALGFRRRLIPLLVALPEQSLILLAGDHGYAINHNFRSGDKHKKPRYQHGECSPQEVLVPWLLLWKVANRPPGRS
ncbi:P-loop containing nucleoside triphosphate hydrolase [Moorella glycerini]|uniref:DUF6079 domain-containing protein n=1 Tax=Neomoorella stamsii TaxID=1266720 RepID=A0A9X7P4Q5_9FIRM|nr:MULTISPECIES: DUF6079 family protein [Moorella]PRR68743.1 hypothetical protein MOST_32720 [Moorella stamsii]CEP68389.1 P-loop containing nucleoside triphosphate hydrolase [Moorella glycerini]